MVEGVPLETGYSSPKDESGVRIPPSPLLFLFPLLIFFSSCTPPLPQDRILVYLINHMPDELVVIDPLNSRILRKSIAGDWLSGLTFLAGGQYCVITATVSSQLRLYNLHRGAVEKILSTPGYPQAVVSHPAEQKLYMLLADPDTMSTSDVTVVDVKTFQIAKRILVGPLLNQFTISPDGKYLFVTSSKHNRIYVVDAEKDELTDKHFELSHSPSYFSVTPDSRKLLVVYNLTDLLQVFDIETRQLIKTIPVGDIPNYTSSSLDGRWFYISDMRSRDIRVVDAEKYEVSATIRLDVAPSIVQPGKRYLYVVTENRFLLVVDPEKGETLRKMPLQSKPVAMGLRHPELG